MQQCISCGTTIRPTRILLFLCILILSVQQYQKSNYVEAINFMTWVICNQSLMGTNKYIFYFFKLFFPNDESVCLLSPPPPERDF